MPTGISGLYKNTKGAKEHQEIMEDKYQIEEMAIDICESRGAWTSDSCEECRMDNRCLYQDIACALHKLGYRKQREGKWIKRSPNPEAMKEFHDMGLGKGMSENSIHFVCSVCGKWGRPSYQFCPTCGAKMKGGEE